MRRKARPLFCLIWLARTQTPEVLVSTTIALAPPVSVLFSMMTAGPAAIRIRSREIMLQGPSLISIPLSVRALVIRSIAEVQVELAVCKTALPDPSMIWGWSKRTSLALIE